MYKVCFALVMSVIFSVSTDEQTYRTAGVGWGGGGGSSNLCLVLTLRAYFNFVSDGGLSMHKCLYLLALHWLTHSILTHIPSNCD